MKIAICTLFEGHYHYGLAALANSLHRSGYRGIVYAGYRGGMPTWARNSVDNTIFEWENSKVLAIAEELKLIFLPVDTEYHLTNYKPDFMLHLLEKVDKEASGIIYLDPDITINAPWSFFEDWLNCGIALCEDVNSPLAEFHPRRVAWRQYFSKHNLKLSFKYDTYVNGGFAGALRTHIGFLKAWKKIQEVMSESIGGLSRSAFKNGEQLPEHLVGDFAPFGKTDQDALNATVEFYNSTYSLIGKDAMAFTAGTVIMYHALGQLKPWNLNPIKQMLIGKPPRSVDKHYWDVVNSPLLTYSSSQLAAKRSLIALASFIGRFYKRN